MNLVEIKPLLITRLESAIKNREPSISINVHIINLFQHIKYLNGGPISFFKNKDSSKQILAHGAYNIFNSIYETEKLSTDFIIGAEKFPSKLPSEGDGYFFTPIIIYTKNSIGHNTELKININYDILKSQKDKSRFIIYISELLNFTNHAGNTTPEVSQIIEEPEIDDWKHRVKKAQENLDKSKKIVLSRKKIISFKKNINESAFIDEIPFNEEQYLFFLKISENENFISISPEKLFSLEKNKVHIDCIAGTRKRGSSKNEDQTLEKELINSAKERSEHLFVANFIEEKMKDFADNITMTKAFDILKLSKVQHLYSEFTGHTKNGKTNYDIMRTLFPTPAVAGTPSEFALTNINKIEKTKRDFYAGACGYICDDTSEFIVGIRSIYTKNNQTTVYGGAGIVSESDYQKEWIETEEKMKNFSFIWERNGK